MSIATGNLLELHLIFFLSTFLHELLNGDSCPIQYDFFADQYMVDGANCFFGLIVALYEPIGYAVGVVLVDAQQDYHGWSQLLQADRAGILRRRGFNRVGGAL